MVRMSQYLPQKKQTRELTERQQKFLDYLITTGGDPKRAGELAGYSEGSYFQVIKSLKHEIIELASNILAQSAPQAALKLTEMMNSMSPSERRISKRKFRKIWKKILKKDPDMKDLFLPKEGIHPTNREKRNRAVYVIMSFFKS